MRPGPAVDAEKRINHWAAKIQVYDRDLATSPREDHREVRQRRRFPLRRDGAGNHDHPYTPIDVLEFKIGPDHPEDLGLGRGSILDHLQRLALLQRPTRRLYRPEKRQTKGVRQLVRAPNARVQRVAQQRERDAEQERKMSPRATFRMGFGAI